MSNKKVIRMRKSTSFKAARGITLIEIMIALVIIAVVVVAAWPRIEEALDSEKVNRVFSHINSIKSAADERRGTKGQYPATVACALLLADEYLKAIPSCNNSNPFNGNYTSAPAADPSRLQITATSVPNGACAKLVDKFTDAGAVAACAGTTLTITI